MDKEELQALDKIFMMIMTGVASPESLRTD